jgi:3'-5' exoribonuclease
MGHIYINTIKAGQAIDDIYLIKDPILRSTTRGDLYIAMYLCDRTGQINGRMWQTTETIYNSLPKPGFVHIVGRSEIYQNNLQIIVNNISVVDSTKVNLEDFLARTEKDTEKLLAEIKQILSKIKNTQLKTLINEFLGDKTLMEKFKTAPAAAKLHHNYLGGLIEHTHNMMNVAVSILPYYPQVQPDLILAGVFLHDIGKTEELNYDIGFSYTDTGQLIGHIGQGLLMVKEKVDKLNERGVKIDKTILDSINHIILSHHGQYEFGSPKLPATPESFMVNYIDDLDAKLCQVNTAIENETSDSDWTGWQKALETRIYRKKIE